MAALTFSGIEASSILGALAIVSLDFARALAMLLVFVLSIGYGVTLEWRWRGQTIGKRLLRLRVIDAHEGPNFFRAHLSPDVCADLTIKGMRFFRADARRFFDDLLALAKQGITVYPRSVYRK